MFVKKNSLPADRSGKTVKFDLFTEKGESVPVYFTVNTYENGYPAEIFLHVGKEGETVHGFAQAWATSISMMLQHGIDPEEIYEKFSNYRFEPQGFTGTDWSPLCTSIVDAIMKYMKKKFPPTATGEEDSYGVMVES